MNERNDSLADLLSIPGIKARVVEQRQRARRKQREQITLVVCLALAAIGVCGVAILEQLPCQDRWDIRIFHDCFYDSTAIANEERQLDGPRQKP